MTQVLQANLQHSKAATAVFCLSTVKQSLDYALIQEPWINNFRIAGMGTIKGSIFSASVPHPRTCIWVKEGLKCNPVLELCSRDVTVIKTVCTKSNIKLLLASVYMPQGDDGLFPSAEVRRLVDLAHESGSELVIGCDSNAHNTAWGCRDTNNRVQQEEVSPERPNLGRRATHSMWSTACRIVTFSKVRWAVGLLRPFKSPGPDEVRPVCLQEGLDTIIHPLCKLFRASLALGHIPLGWCNSRIAFIPKPGRDSYTDPKSFRPISLSSFFLKILEKLVSRYMMDTALRTHPLHINQHAYVSGRSCETALHQLVSKIEKALESSEVALGAFLDIQGAFDNTGTPAILNAVRARGFHGIICRWIESLLLSRKVRLSLHNDTIEARTTRGCPQGGVLSPLLWNLVADDLIRTLCENLWIASGNNKGHSKIVQVVHNDELDLPSDHMSKKYSFGKPFKVLIPDRKDWSGGKGPIPTGDLECYTDGSKIKNGGTGAGHSGIKGNEAADRLANTASATTLLGPQPFCGISRNSVCSAIASWAKEKHRKRWIDFPLLRVTGGAMKLDGVGACQSPNGGHRMPRPKTAVVISALEQDSLLNALLSPIYTPSIAKAD
ncbi:uncharacterized protein LOC129002833 [Macrosteles quadrilineatus]|uniref:uncharacterized protein LOC129002833 n=1 Tax=Macrosteles quadrilineatus TaxID=74068 RepID=UPI0023E1450A|nr:uncharacterized protein LOC129002833 [Macrosteles quadrilineatus]